MCPRNFATADGDLDDEDFRFGCNYSAEPEYAFVYTEVLRDAHNDGAFPGWAGVYTQSHHEQQTVVHEIGHQFELYEGMAHPATNYSVMGSPPEPTRPDSFAEDERLIIRSIASV